MEVSEFEPDVMICSFCASSVSCTEEMRQKLQVRRIEHCCRLLGYRPICAMVRLE